MKKVYWDENANPIGTHLANIIYELRSEDNGDDLILDAVCVDDFEENSENIAYDALVTEYRLLERKMNVMRRVMNRVSADLKVREDNGPDDMGVIISKPFKRNGTSNVAVLFQLTDGQTISIVLHNPDTTPNKIAPTDELISWKWMVNKKDVTIAVAPENGKDLNVNEVARRIMRLAEKNSAAFKRANERRAERIANIEKQKAEIEDLEAELARAKSDCEAAEVEYQDALEKLDTKKKERTESIEKAEERKRENEKREAEELAKKEAEEYKKQSDLRTAMNSLGLRTSFSKVIEENIKPGKYNGNFIWEVDGLGFLDGIDLAEYDKKTKKGVYYAQNGERMNDAESQVVFEKFVSGLKVDLTPGQPPVYIFNDGTRMTDMQLLAMQTGSGIESGSVKTKEEWETYPLNSFSDLYEYMTEFMAWTEKKPQSKRIIDTLRSWGWTDFKGVNSEGQKFTARINPDNSVEVWDAYGNPLTTGTFAVFVGRVVDAKENGSLTHMDEAEKKAKAGTIRTADEAEVEALRREEELAKKKAQQSTDPQWEEDKAYLQSLIDGTANMDDRKLHKAKLKEVNERVKNDDEKLALWKSAMNAWKTYAIAKAKEALSKRG